MLIVDCYRNKMRIAIQGSMQDIQEVAPHYETRVAKRRWSARIKRGENKNGDDNDE